MPRGVYERKNGKRKYTKRNGKGKPPFFKVVVSEWRIGEASPKTAMHIQANTWLDAVQRAAGIYAERNGIPAETHTIEMEVETTKSEDLYIPQAA